MGGGDAGTAEYGTSGAVTRLPRQQLNLKVGGSGSGTRTFRQARALYGGRVLRSRARHGGSSGYYRKSAVVSASRRSVNVPTLRSQPAAAPAATGARAHTYYATGASARHGASGAATRNASGDTWV